MAEVEKETVEYLATLARIAVSPDEEESLVVDLKKMVSYVEQLREVDTSKVKPCSYITECLSKMPLRKDEVHHTLSREDFLNNTPKDGQISGMVRVPPVMKQEL